jgi:hypothetical protein
MGLSRERIRQIEAQAKKKLRRIFAIHTLPRSPLKGPLPARLLQALKDGGTKRGRGRRVRSATGNGAMASAMPIGPGVSAMRVSETISVPSGGHRNLDRPI